MTPEEQLLLQQQQKLAGIEQQQKYNMFRSPGQVQGAAVQDFAAGKQAANSQAQGYGANPAPISQPVVQQAQKVEPVKQVQPIEKVKPVERITQQPSITSMDDLARAMGYTSPQEEERMRKSSIANQRILAIGDALRHIGNIANTVRYAPAQQFNNPVQDELTRYQQGKALRDRANQTYLTYQQAKAAQDQKAKQWQTQMEYTMAKDAAAAQALKDYRDASMKANEDKWRSTLAYKALNDEANRKQRGEHLKEMEKQGRQRIGIASQNSKNAQAYRQWKMNGGGGGKGGTLTFRGKNGFYSKQMSSQEANAFYNQAFEELSKMRGANGKPIIDKNAVSGSVVPGLLGGNKINMQARKEAVDNAIYNHPEAGEFLRQQFEFAFDPRGTQQPAQYQQSQNINFAPWNSTQSLYGGESYASTFVPNSDDDEDEFEDMFDNNVDFSGISF